MHKSNHYNYANLNLEKNKFKTYVLSQKIFQNSGCLWCKIVRRRKVLSSNYVNSKQIAEL